MKEYRKKYQAEYWASDIKPKNKRIKKKIQTFVRQLGKKIIQKFLKEKENE